jgi:hypothetical protein
MHVACAMLSKATFVFYVYSCPKIPLEVIITATASGDTANYGKHALLQKHILEAFA